MNKSPNRQLPALIDRFRRRLSFARSLQFTFTAQITVAIAVLFAIGNVILFRSASSIMVRDTYLRNSDKVLSLVNSINVWKDRTVQLMSSLSKEEGIRTLDAAKISQEMKLVAKLSTNRIWRVFDSNGKLIYSSDKNELDSHAKKVIELRHISEQGFQEAMGGRFNWTVAYIQAGGRLKGCLNAAQPITNKIASGQETTIGSLEFCIPLSKLGESIGVANTDSGNLNTAEPGGQETTLVFNPNHKSPNYIEPNRGDFQGSVTYLVFGSGNMVFPTATDSRFDSISMKSPQQLSTSIWGRLNQIVAQNSQFNVFQEIEIDGHRLLAFAVASKSSGSNWIAVNITDRATVFKTLEETLHRLLILQITIIILIAIAIYFVCRQLSRPLQKLIRRIQCLSTLNLDRNSDYKIGLGWIRDINQVSEATNRLNGAMDSFARYLPREVVRLLLHEGKQAELGGCTENIAVLFTDIQDFTTFTESIPVKKLFGYLNEYFTVLSKCVTEHNGTIDKYIGDSLMAMWGMPSKLENPCEEACEAALAIRTASNGLRDAWTLRGEPLIFNTRIGLHFGEAIIGNVGASERFNYTIIGDTVNLASRLEGANKNYGTTIIVSEDVIDQLRKEKTDYKFCFRMLGRVRVKGKHLQTMIYELQGHRSSLRANQIHDLEIWNEVMRVRIESGPDAAIHLLAKQASTIEPSPLLMQLKAQLDEDRNQATP